MYIPSFEEKFPRAHMIVISCLSAMIVFSCFCYYCCIYKCSHHDEEEEEDEEEEKLPPRQNQVASFTETVAIATLAATSIGVMEMPIGTALATCNAETATNRIATSAAQDGMQESTV